MTRADWKVARELVVGLTDDLLSHDADYWDLIGHRARLPFAEAAKRALQVERLAALSAGRRDGAWGAVERALARALGRGVSS